MRRASRGRGRGLDRTSGPGSLDLNESSPGQLDPSVRYQSQISQQLPPQSIHRHTLPRIPSSRIPSRARNRQQLRVRLGSSRGPKLRVWSRAPADQPNAFHNQTSSNRERLTRASCLLEREQGEKGRQCAIRCCARCVPPPPPPPPPRLPKQQRAERAEVGTVEHWARWDTHRRNCLGRSRSRRPSWRPARRSRRREGATAKEEAS